MYPVQQRKQGLGDKDYHNISEHQGQRSDPESNQGGGGNQQSEYHRVSHSNNRS